MSAAAERPPVAGKRQRSSSIQKVLQHMSDVPADHRLATGDYQPSGDPLPPSPVEKASLALATGTSGAKPPQRPALKRSPSVFRDLTNFRWLREPTSSLKMIAFIYGSWLLHRFALPDRHNPLDRLVHIQYPLKVDINDGGVQRYGKGWDDYYFLAFHVVVMAFIRQASVEWLLRPFAPKLGIKSGVKVDRFTEQGYSIMYWGTMSAIGIYVMHGLPTWWYKTEQFWLGYPHWRMTGELKTYYLLQASYWIQQIFVLVLKIEKPRSDYVELCIHHCVTLWLIGWSYTLNLTYIGVSIFVTMDLSDTFLALAKCLNYSTIERVRKCSDPTFAVFLVIWTYTRHYLNLRMLWSVWHEYKLVPAWARKWNPAREAMIPPWVQWQIFTPIALLQLVNLFWYVLIWRVVVRILRSGSEGADVREDEEE